MDAWIKREPSARTVENARLTDRIREIHAENRKVYGSPRIHAELVLADGEHVGRKRVERLMREAGLSGLVARKRAARRSESRASESAKTSSTAPFSQRRRTGSGSPTSRICARGKDGCTWSPSKTSSAAGSSVRSVADHLHTELVTDALEMALAQRRPEPGLIWHSDQGSQFVSLAFGQAARGAGIAQSMGSRGDCWDNAVAESFFATLKKELIHGRS